MTPHLGSFILRRAVSAVVLVLVVASAAVLLARLAPGDHLEFELTPTQIAAERHRLGLDAPLHVQYFAWLRRFARFDLGESTRYPGRRVSDLIAERIGNTLILGGAALLIATALGIPLGVVSGRAAAIRSRWQPAASRSSCSPCRQLSCRSGCCFWRRRLVGFPLVVCPAGGVGVMLHHLALPVLALGLPVAATLERLQSRAMADALRHPSVQAARARGPSTRLVWSHAMRLSLTPVLAVYGVIAATLISGSFAVEYVMTWPGLGRLLYDGLIARDANVVAGCAATGRPPSQSASFSRTSPRRCRPEGRGSAMRRTRAIGGALLAGLVLAALFAPVLTPTLRCASSPTTRTRRRCVLTSFRPTEIVWPFVRPVKLVDRLERRFEATATRCRSDGSTAGCCYRSMNLADRGFPWEPIRWPRCLLAPALRCAAVTRWRSSHRSAHSSQAWRSAAWQGSRGRLETALMAVADFVLVLPAIYVVLALRAAMLVLSVPQVFWALSLVLAAAGWPLVARGVRGSSLPSGRRSMSKLHHGCVPCADSATSPPACHGRLPSLHRDDDGAGVCGVGRNAHAGGAGISCSCSELGGNAPGRLAGLGLHRRAVVDVAGDRARPDCSPHAHAELGTALRLPLSAQSRKSLLKRALGIPPHVFQSRTSGPLWNSPAHQQVFQRVKPRPDSKTGGVCQNEPRDRTRVRHLILN